MLESMSRFDHQTGNPCLTSKSPKVNFKMTFGLKNGIIYPFFRLSHSINMIHTFPQPLAQRSLTAALGGLVRQKLRAFIAPLGR